MSPQLRAEPRAQAEGRHRPDDHFGSGRPGVAFAFGAAGDHSFAPALGLRSQWRVVMAQEWTLQNFADAWGVELCYKNSMFLLILKVPLGVLISAMLAFALAKLGFVSGRRSCSRCSSA